MARQEYNIKYAGLKNPVLIYSEGYADSTRSEKWAISNSDEVGKLLNAAHIKFAAHDSGHSVRIIINLEDFEICKTLAEKSQYTPFWAWWLKQYPSPEICIIKGDLI